MEKIFNRFKSIAVAMDFCLLAAPFDQRYNHFTMLLFVYGSDNFRTQEKVSQLKTAFRDKHDPRGTNIETFPGVDGKFDAPAALQSVSTMPFLSKHRMVIIRDLLSTTKKEQSPLWETGLQRIPDSTIVVLWETGDVASIEKKPLFKKLSAIEGVHLYPFDELVGASLTKWIIERVKSQSGMIEPNAVRSLVERVGTELWQMHQEIDKLIAYANGRTITETMTLELVNASFEGKIFELVDALSKKDSRRAVQLLEEERFAGSEDHYILSMFSRQIRLLIGARAVLDENPRASNNDVATQLDVHPFVATKVLAQAKNFSLKKLLDAHEKLFIFDRDLKNGGIDVDLAVDLLATDLLVK